MQAVNNRTPLASDCGWDGFGGSSRPEAFPEPQMKVKVKLKNGGQVMKIDKFFAS